MVHNGTSEVAKSCDKFICEKCHYSTSIKSSWDKHLKTKKHNLSQMVHNGTSKVAKSCVQKSWVCECGRSYKFHSGYYRHKSTCKFQPENKTISEQKSDIAIKGFTKEDVVDIVQAITPIMIDAIGSKSSISGSGSNNTINNQNVNVNLFLNEQCGDAMSIQGFAKQLSLTVADLIKGNKPTAITGVSNIVIDNLKPLPLTERPMHCIDVAKRKWHVKDAIEGWKEEDGESIINHSEFNICKKFHDLWEEMHPNWSNNEKLKNQYTELIVAINTNPTSAEIEKALKKIGPECKLTLSDITSRVKLK